MCVNAHHQRFSDLGLPRRVWAVSAIHGELQKLYALHDAILDRLQVGDRIVYLGNYTGYGAHSRETVDEILTFRRLALSLPGMKPSDITYLKGRQEHLWHKLMMIQFAHKPEETLPELLSQGLSQTLESYGIDTNEGLRCAKEGVRALTRWTQKIRDGARAQDGHEIWQSQMRRAAYTTDRERHPALFVNAGIAQGKTLEEQEDHFFYADTGFSSMTESYRPFDKVIRGYDPEGAGIHVNCVTATIDGGCGFGGNLICAGLRGDGKITELLEA